MRKITDKSGFETFIEFVKGENAFAGLQEGTPYLVRKMRLSSGRQNMRMPGCYFHGLDDIERELNAMPPNHNVWPHNEKWTAKLVSASQGNARRREYLVVHWFQQDEDPMQRLRDILSGLEFREYCRLEPHEVED